MQMAKPGDVWPGPKRSRTDSQMFSIRSFVNQEGCHYLGRPSRRLGRARWLCRRVYVSSGFGDVIWPIQINEKLGKSPSTSSTEEALSPDDKKIKYNATATATLTRTETSCEQDEELSNMAETIMPKLELVIEKLGKVESKLEDLENNVKSVDAKVNKLQAKVECFESFQKKTVKKVEDIESGMNFTNTERESFETKLKGMQKQLDQLKDEKLYMEVYQRRENLRFFEIEEAGTAEEDTREVLVDFLKAELGMENADEIEFQRVHRIGKRPDSIDEKPRQIIARFLRYPDREKIMSNARKLKGKGFGISADLPKEIMERRKKKMQQFKKAKEDAFAFLCSSYDLIDIWRIRNPDIKRFTWRQKNPVVQRRLDFWLITSSLQEEVENVDIIPAIRSDHLAISIHINGIEETERGPSFWKFNSSLLEDEDYIKVITDKYGSWLEEGKDIQDPRVLWDFVKYKIRYETITYSKNKRACRSYEADASF
ncbi:hypothetical protein ACROYT_G041712 [Oculina patagonica]